MSEEEMLKYLNRLLDSTPNRNANFVIQITSKDVYNIIDFITKKQENSVSKDKISELRNEDNIDYVQFKLKELLEE